VQADQDAVLQFIVSDLGFDDNRPMAACLLYKALLHWRSFEAERTSVFDRVIQTIGGAIEGTGRGGNQRQQQQRPPGCYWLTNAACLLHLLQRSLRPGGMGAGGPGAAGAGAAGLQRRGARGAAAANATLLGRMAQVSCSCQCHTGSRKHRLARMRWSQGAVVGPSLSAQLASPEFLLPLAVLPAPLQMSLRGSSDWQGADGLSSPSGAPGQGGGASGSASPGPPGNPAEDGLALVDAKYPALLFKQQLTAYVEKLFGPSATTSRRTSRPCCRRAFR